MSGHLVTAAEFADRAEAEVARARLAADGIDAVVQDDREGGLSPGFYSEFSARLLVRQEDVEEARSLLG